MNFGFQIIDDYVPGGLSSFGFHTYRTNYTRVGLQIFDEPATLGTERKDTQTGAIIMLTLLSVFVLVFHVYPNIACCCKKEKDTRTDLILRHGIVEE